MKTLYLVSGIGPDSSGTGRLLQHLAASVKSVPGWRIRLISIARASVPTKRLIRERRFTALLRESWRRLPNAFFWPRVYAAALLTRAPLVLFHMQSLGTRRALRLLERWRGPRNLFVLDGGVYCIRSYNHVDGDLAPCTACVGGDFSAIDRRACTPFPLPDPDFRDFVAALPRLASDAGLRLLTQSESQTRLLRGHFPPDSVRTVGLWTADWNSLRTLLARAPAIIDGDPEFDADIVFHGNLLAAKGFDWSVEVARALPERRFLFPGPKPARVVDPPNNALFRPMTWEGGLADAVQRAPLTLVPSLWSASIEGALVKTILLAPRTAVVASPTAYSGELADDNVLYRLPADPRAAAEMLRTALAAAPLRDRDSRLAWFEGFTARNRPVLEHIVAVAGSPPESNDA